ncbi:hypothetical protein Dsin_032053 [Dipteronia sinensis]|uniref:RNase H type-1 domain-containing protein n=1 Tax=Dipteronia sinensis TaxID=43782 RepID=A0AAD9ZML3_9ROSI|nr:hypothetical protein Dsin_032053 [Dipteronia sinensis]
MGVIIRGSNGHVLISSTQKFTDCFSPSVAEAAAILRGLQSVINCGLLPTMLENDAKWVVCLINSDSQSRADIGVVVSDIVALSRQFNISISFAPRATNMTAHALAKFGLKSMDNHVWFEEIPPCLMSVLLVDSLPLGGS